MTKRNLFAELTEGFDALAAARKGKKALAVLTVSDHVITHEAMDADARERTLNDMVEVALAALSAN